MQGGAILLVCRWRGSGPWGWGGDQVTLAEPEQEGPLSGLLDLSQRLFSRSCPKITPNRSPLFWDHLGSPTPDQRGKEHSFWFLGGRGLERQPRLSETREHRARLLAPHPGAAGPGEVRVTTRVVPAKTAARVPGRAAPPGQLQPPVLTLTLCVYSSQIRAGGSAGAGPTGRNPSGAPALGRGRGGSRQDPAGLPPCTAPATPDRNHSGLVCAAAGLWGPGFRALAGPSGGWGFLPHLSGRRGAWVGSALRPALLGDRPTFLGLRVLVCKGV